MNRKQVTLDMKETLYQQICRLADERNTTPGRLVGDAIKGWLLMPRSQEQYSNREGIPANTRISQSALDGTTPEQTYPGANNPLSMYNAMPPELRPDYHSYTDEQLNAGQYNISLPSQASDHYPDGILRSPTVPGNVSQFEKQIIKSRSK